MAVEVEPWLAVLWMVMKRGLSRLAARRWGELRGRMRALMFASRANLVMLRGTMARGSGTKRTARGVRREASCWHCVQQSTATRAINNKNPL